MLRSWIVTDASMDEVDTVSNGSDRGRVYMEEQATGYSSPSLFMSRVGRPGSPSPRRHKSL